MHTIKLTPDELQYLMGIIDDVKFKSQEEAELLKDIEEKLEKSKEVWC